MKSTSWKRAGLCFAAAFCTCGVLLALLGAEPFGNRSLVAYDAEIQYIDFFTWLRQTLLDGSWRGYSFGKTLGGNMMLVFSYYLSSPFLLLVVLFQPQDLYLFFNLLVVLKLSTAAATCAFFLDRRFEARLSTGITLLLSLSYALSEYAVVQCNNIMWLDGMYMLPLILLGVHRLVAQRKSLTLSLAVGLSILFNWYSGGINCLYAILWFLAEYLMLPAQQGDRRFRAFLSRLIHFGCAMAIGVLLSCVLFLPTVAAFGSGGSLPASLGGLFDLSFNGSVPFVIQSFTPGLRSRFGYLSLFCGCLTMLAAAAVFFSPRCSRREKAAAAALLALAVCACYFTPLFAAFSLFTYANNFHYRYSYTGILAMVFLAGLFFSRRSQHTRGALLKGCALWMAAQLAAFWASPQVEIKALLINMIFSAAAAGVCMLWLRSGRTALRRSAAVLCCAMVAGQLLYNAQKVVTTTETDAYRAYYPEQKAQMDGLKAYDSGLYRVNQLETHHMTAPGKTANYNEALAYQYWSISGYTSSPEPKQRFMLDRMGYQIMGPYMCVVGTSILPADSLLGVKYVVTRQPMYVLEQVEELGVHNGKSVYKNPWSLPLAFAYTPSGMEVDTEADVNPFEYINMLYRHLLNEQITLFSPVEYGVFELGENSESYELLLSDKPTALYANLYGGSKTGAMLNINDEHQIAYTGWLSQSVFYVPTMEGDATAYIETDGLEVMDPQLYELDLDAMTYAAQTLSAGAPSSMEIRDGYARFEADGSKGERLYIAIPYDPGWSITINGRKADWELFSGCMYTLALDAGENIIEMRYTCRGQRAGLMASAAGVALLIAAHQIEKKKNRRLCGKQSA